MEAETQTEAEAEAEEEKVAKRARKRSRYLSPPYTDDDGPADPDQQELSNVAAADMLSALHAAALLDSNAAASVKALFLRFFAMHRSSNSVFVSAPSTSIQRTADAGLTAKPELNPITPSSITTSSKKKKKKDSRDAIRKRPGAAAPRLPLTDIRKNLEKMISSLGCSPSKEHSHGLASEMRCLLAKVDKMLAAQAAHHPH
ncbi:hypothetical protein GUJ93_ZPchr0010g11150 [Zizania palustris]|uniref:Uncharacterized protein n=1 Tax=Zizania palustris TaxID=103762 RepID=A0A8J5W8T3_ZIZPA|nr:hypothetical protein GUJ93_ZPchr0010g11150 [Zizania palustris]KAG8084677.1 hypothetical protein GUJ93_ZPchr0010g11150 [Zizania palustris]KAG8084678.1 hypothetical protein GUJ93_ZPchr0010g11150 [Zizania palustris]